MKKTALILMALAALFLIVGCGDKAADETKKDGDGGGTEAKKDLSPTDTMKAFIEAFRKGGKGLDEAVKYMTEKAGMGFKGIMEIEKEDAPDFKKVEYGEEKIDGDKASVLVTTIEQKKDKEKTEKLVFHMDKVDGKWLIVGVQPEGRKEVQRFDDEKLLKEIEEIKKMKEEEGGSEKK
jgi:hypothetical protein